MKAVVSDFENEAILQLKERFRLSTKSLHSSGEEYTIIVNYLRLSAKLTHIIANYKVT